MQIKLSPAALKSKLYSTTIRKDHVIIDRMEPPLINVYYNPVSGKGNLMSYASGTRDKFSEKQIEEYVQITIQWAKKNIKLS